MFWRRIKYLPQSLQLALALLGAAPLAFLVLAGLHGDVVVRLPVWYAGYLAVAYAALPIALASLLLHRHIAFLYAFGVECVMLVAGALLREEGVPNFLRSLHYGYAIAFAGMALMLVNKDILFPFIFSNYRGWRRAPRIEVNQLVKVHVPRLERTYEMMIEDCSLTGVALFGYEDALSDMLAEVQRGELVVVAHSAGKTAHRVPMQFLWHTESSTVVKMGLAAVDRAAMTQFFRALGFKQNYSGVRRVAASLWGRRAVRKALNYAFAFVLLVVMLMPSLGSVSRKQLLEARTWRAMLVPEKRRPSKPPPPAPAPAKAPKAPAKTPAPAGR